jgi:DNA-binding response OmpR family regulator
MPTILIVDDEPRLVAAFEAVLTLEGYTVRTASAAQRALQVLDIEHPHLVLLDINLPGTDGLDLLRRMRERMPQVAIIIVSGFLDDVTCHAALHAGALDCLQKPVNLQTLKDRVAQVITARDATRVAP